MTREAAHGGRQAHSANGSLHGDAGGVPLQPGAQAVLRAAEGKRESEQGGDHGLFAEAAHDLKRDGERQSQVGREQGATNRLTFVTVAYRFCKGKDEGLFGWLMARKSVEGSVM